MKKILAFTLTAALTLGILTGCGSSTKTDTTASTAAATEEATDSAAADTAAADTAEVTDTTAAESTDAAAATAAAESTGTDVAASTDSAKADTTDLGLMSDGVLSVGCEIGYPPFEDFADDGTTPIGYDVDIITEVASRLGLKVNIINTAWDGIFAGLGVNYDVVCSACTITDERLETMDFSDPYINNYQAIVVPADSKLTINSFTDLDGMTVGVQKETTSDILMSDYKSTGSIDAEIVANEKVTSCFTQLTNGEIDAISVDSTVADGYVASEPDKYKIAYLDKEEAEQFGVAITKGNEGIKTAINKALADMEAEGFIKETYDYWFGSGASAAE